MSSRKLPEGWEVKRLDEVCENLDSKRIPITKAKRINGNIPYYGASGVVDYVVDYIFEENLLLISEDGANLLTRTYPIAFSISGKSWVNNHAHVLRFNHQESQQFIEYFFNSISLEPHVSGMAQPKLNQKSLNSIPVPIPPLPEQKRIVALLDKTFAGINQAVANAEKNLANGRELFESYLNTLFTKNGEGWVEKKLTDILIIQPRNGWSPPAKHHSDTGTPVLTLSSVTGFNFDRSKIKYTSAQTNTDAHYWAENGALFISRSNTPELVGHVAICSGIKKPTIYPDLIMKMKLDSKIANTRFVYYQLRSAKFRTLIMNSATGANPTMKKINQKVVKSLPISLPSIDDQKIIVENLERLFNETQHLQSIYSQKLTALQELKQSILQKAFSGELTTETMGTDG